MAHWHITRHHGDEDVYATDSIFDALDYAADELDIIAEGDYELIRIHGDAGDYEEAYKAWDRQDRITAPIANARNMVKQNGLPTDQRAPLYQDPATADDLLKVAALNVVNSINAESPIGFYIEQCYLDPCETLDDGKGE